MLTLLIALLISLGIVTESETVTMTDQERQELIENNNIVIEDFTIF